MSAVSSLRPVSATRTRATPASRRAAPVAGPLIELLDQLAVVVGSLTPRQYAGKPAFLADSSIGSHVRHCLDHVAALVAAAGTGRLDYDRRERGTPLEQDPAAALERIHQLKSGLARLTAGQMQEPVSLDAVLSPHDAPVKLTSTLGRELAYVVSHSTHHNAIIGFLVQALGVAVPERFGYAASTVAWMEKALCAR